MYTPRVLENSQGQDLHPRSINKTKNTWVKASIPFSTGWVHSEVIQELYSAQKDKCLSQLTEISAKNPILPNSQRIISMRPKVICKSASKHSEEKSAPTPPPQHTHIR